MPRGATLQAATAVGITENILKTITFIQTTGLTTRGATARTEKKKKQEEEEEDEEEEEEEEEKARRRRSRR